MEKDLQKKKLIDGINVDAKHSFLMLRSFVINICLTIVSQDGYTIKELYDKISNLLRKENI
jgi:hypothetical protein